MGSAGAKVAIHSSVLPFTSPSNTIHHRHPPCRHTPPTTNSHPPEAQGLDALQILKRPQLGGGVPLTQDGQVVLLRTAWQAEERSMEGSKADGKSRGFLAEENSVLLRWLILRNGQRNVEGGRVARKFVADCSSG